MYNTRGKRYIAAMCQNLLLLRFQGDGEANTADPCGHIGRSACEEKDRDDVHSQHW